MTDSEITFKLPVALEYQKDGEATGNSTFEIIMRAPSYNDRKFARALRQKITNLL